MAAVLSYELKAGLESLRHQIYSLCNSCILGVLSFSPPPFNIFLNLSHSLFYLIRPSELVLQLMVSQKEKDNVMGTGTFEMLSGHLDCHSPPPPPALFGGYPCIWLGLDDEMEAID